MKAEHERWRVDLWPATQAVMTKWTWVPRWATAALCMVLSCPAAAKHTNNWAVLVCASRYWFNYRHIANTLSLYRTVKRLGIPDSQIILMLADDMACNPRNPHPSRIFNNMDQKLNLYDAGAEVDYRGYEVTVDSFLDVLKGQHHPAVPASKRLLTDNTSNILVYVTGHGGEDFLKFQDKGEMQSSDLADAIHRMWEQGRYHELLFLAETCQAASLYSKFRSPNVLAAASSSTGEDSYSHHVDMDVGLAVIDRFTYYLLNFFEGIRVGSRATMAQLFDSIRPQRLFSTMCTREDLFPRALSSVPVTDFFGGAAGSSQIAAAFGAGAPPAAGSAAQQPDAAQDCREWGPPSPAEVGCCMGSGGASCSSQDAEQLFAQLWQHAQNQTRDVIQTPLASCGDCLIVLLVLVMLGAAAALQHLLAM